MLERTRPNSGRELRKRTQPARHQEVDAIARMGAGIAHDLNNVLMIISGNAELLRHELCSQKAERLLSTIDRMTHRAKGLTEKLLSFAGSRPVEPDVVDIGRTVQELSGALRQCLRRDIGIEVQVPDLPRPRGIRACRAQSCGERTGCNRPKAECSE